MSNHNSSSSAAHSNGAHLGHILDPKIYVGILVLLLILTVVTVAVSRVDLGEMNLVVAMVIASLKALVVALFFMHLKYEHPLTWLYAIFPLALLAIMIGGVFIDNPFRVDGNTGKMGVAIESPRVPLDEAPAHH